MPMTMKERIDHAMSAINAYTVTKGEPDRSDGLYEDTDASDLIADLLNLQKHLGFDIELTLERAKMHFESEEADEQQSRLEVQMEIGNDWENVWRIDAGENSPDGTPQTFATLDEAIQAIKEHITDCINAVEGGDMQDSPDPAEFRIVDGSGQIYEFQGMPWRYESATGQG